VIIFPAPAEGHVLTRTDLNSSPVTFMEITKDVLLTDILAPAGQGRACLTGEHDMVPGVMPPRSYGVP